MNRFPRGADCAVGVAQPLTETIIPVSIGQTGCKAG